MRNRTITTMFATLLFAVSQGVYAQTEHDTLQRELKAALEQVVNEQRRLQQVSASGYYEMRRETLQLRAESLYGEVERGSLSANRILEHLLRQQIELDKRQDMARLREVELRKREYEIKQQIEALQSREGKIHGQREQLSLWLREDAQQRILETLRKQQVAWQRYSIGTIGIMKPLQLRSDEINTARNAEKMTGGSVEQ